MSDLADILWQQFGTEVGEHLDLIERELGPAAQGDGEGVAGLFRAFHSIKGLAAAMGVQALEILAHSGESLLAGVRDGLVPLNETHRALLIDVADAMRTMSEEATAVRGDVAGRDALATRLADAVAAFRTGGAAADVGATAVADGVDPRLAALGASLARMMDRLVQALRPGAPSEALSQLDADLLGIDGMIGELGLLGLRRQVRRLSRAAHDGRPDIGLLHDLALALGVLEEMVGHDVGGRALLAHVAQSGAGDLIRACARAGEALRLAGGGERDTGEMADLLEAAALRADLLALGRSATLLRLAIDLLRRGSLDGEADIALTGVLDRIVEHAAANPPADVAAETAHRLEEMLRALVAGRGVEATIERAMALGVDAALLDHLSDEARERLGAAIDDPGQILFEVDADLESDAALAGIFAAWVADNADPVTSLVVARDGRSRTRLLLATPARPAAVLADLGALDRGGERLRVRICDGRKDPARTDAGPAVLEETLRVPARVIDDILERLGDLMPIAAGLEALVKMPALQPREREALLHGLEGAPSPDEIVDRADERRDALRRISDTFARALKGLRDAALELRIVPVDLLFGRYPRLVRDMARTMDKQVVLTLEANGARIDKGMIERLADPLMHMIRNAVDHGIEKPAERQAAGKPAQASIVLRAEQRGEHVTIALSDDGRGIDTEAVRSRAVERGLLPREAARVASPDTLHRLIFEPGFSTSERVSATSGRGVGMDVVASTVAELGGSVVIRTRRGEGTTIALELPLSVALQSTLLIEQSGQVFALPDRNVTAVARHGGGGEIALAGAGATPVVGLAGLLGLDEARDGAGQVVVIAAGTRRLGLAVERVVRRADILVKESHPVIAAVPGLSGAARLGDGSIVVILDPDGLIGLAKVDRPA